MHWDLFTRYLIFFLNKISSFLLQFFWIILSLWFFGVRNFGLEWFLFVFQVHAKIFWGVWPNWEFWVVMWFSVTNKVSFIRKSWITCGVNLNLVLTLTILVNTFSQGLQLFTCIPANRPDFIRTVPIFDFQNLKKLRHPDFLEFPPVNISDFKVI